MDKLVHYADYRRLSTSIASGPDAQRKALLQDLVAEVRLQSRRAIVPVFRLPLKAKPNHRGRFVNSSEWWTAAYIPVSRTAPPISPGRSSASERLWFDSHSLGPEGVEPLTFPGPPFSLVGPGAGNRHASNPRPSSRAAKTREEAARHRRPAETGGE